MTNEHKTRIIQNRDNWKAAKPQKLPRPAYWPFFLAMGVAFLAWGLLAGWIISVAGTGILVISLIGWINELRHERRENKD